MGGRICAGSSNGFLNGRDSWPPARGTLTIARNRWHIASSTYRDPSTRENAVESICTTTYAHHYPPHLHGPQRDQNPSSIQNPSLPLSSSIPRVITGSSIETVHGGTLPVSVLGS
ncbi:hypothetical protein DPSP01_007863 [Paraphaeosphaeria sporulosa]